MKLTTFITKIPAKRIGGNKNSDWTTMNTKKGIINKDWQTVLLAKKQIFK